MKRALFAIAILFVAAASPAQTGAARLFNDACASCHTVGGGELAGPDLAGVAHWPVPELRNAVKRMQDNAGALTTQQIDELVALLQARDVKAQLAGGSAPVPILEIPPEERAASAETGRRLFFGEEVFANHGTPCFACHTVAGRGGNLAVDLTQIHAKRGDAAVLIAAQQPPFPLMKAAYSNHTVTKQEAYHLLAFLKQPPPSQRAPDRAGVVHAAAGGLAALVFVVVGISAHRKRGGAPAESRRHADDGRLS